MHFNSKPVRACSSPFMALSHSSLFLSHSHSSLPSYPNLSRRYALPRRTQTLSCSSDNSTSDKKSFAVATGELFLGLASRLFVKRPRRGPNGEMGSVVMFDDTGPDDERIGAVVKDEAEPQVIWEQRVKDVEAERRRRVVTSPGFSFSAAGLLFPYHLGVAQFLIEKGYIKVIVFPTIFL